MATGWLPYGFGVASGWLETNVEVAVKEARNWCSQRHPHPRRILVCEPNRCNLEPFKPKTPEIALYSVLARGQLTLQVVCLGLADLQLPLRPPKCPAEFEIAIKVRWLQPPRRI